MLRITIIAILFLSIARQSFAQFATGYSFLDTDWFENHTPKGLNDKAKFKIPLGNKQHLLIGAKNPQVLALAGNIDSILVNFIKDYERIKPNLDDNNSSRFIRYEMVRGYPQISIKEKPTALTAYQLKDNQAPVILKKVFDTLWITKQVRLKRDTTSSSNIFNIYNIEFYFILNDMDNLASIVQQNSINQHITRALLAVEKYKPKDLKSGKYDFNYTELDTTKSVTIRLFNTNTNIANRKDLKKSSIGVVADSMYKLRSNRFSFSNIRKRNAPIFVISPSIGIGYLGNRLLMNTQIDVSYIPTRRHNIGYTIGLKQVYPSLPDVNGSGGFLQNTNSLLSIGFTFFPFDKLSSNPYVMPRQTMGGLYLGYLVARNGDFFRANTWNLSAMISTKGGNLKVVPEIYFNAFFKNIMPGLRLQIGF